jgi:protein tyrosine phosphatase (PTP) superfamily phosphohydrolase (DUF442 family)
LRAIRARLHALRESIKAGEDHELVVWVVEELAIAQRPLRDHPRFHGRAPLPAEARSAVVDWVHRILSLGFRGIICLSHPKELRYYEGVSLHRDGLLGLYQASGFDVRHLPSLDPAHGSTAEERARRRAAVEGIKKQAKAAFDEMDKPVLLHCSAGIDRSAPVAVFIATHTGS